MCAKESEGQRELCIANQVVVVYFCHVSCILL